MIGIEISHSSIRFARLKEEGFDFSETFLDFNRSILEQVVDFIKQVREQFGDLREIGMAVSGVVDKNENRILYSRHFAELTAVDFVRRIEQECELRVSLENDANAAAWAEYKLGAGQGSESVFYILLSKGVGGAFVLNGNLWRGAQGFAGEIGQIPVDAEENLRLEDVASSDGIISRIKSRIHQDHTSSLARISEELITITDIIREANNGDDFTQMMLERTGAYVGIVVASALNLLNFEKVIMGGSIMQAGDAILRGIRQSAEAFTFKPSFESAQIVSGHFLDRAATLGAALMVG